MPDTPAITGFHHVAIFAKDFDRTIAFWTDVMGFKPKAIFPFEGDNRGALLNTGDGNYLEIFEKPEVEAPTGAQAIFHYALRTTQLDALIEKIRAAGMTITREPEDLTITGNTVEGEPDELPIRIAFFNGPDGESVELFQNELT